MFMGGTAGNSKSGDAGLQPEAPQTDSRGRRIAVTCRRARDSLGPARPAHHDVAMSSVPAKRPCLLLVDDTPANIQVLVGLLQADFELKVATRGTQALKICEQTPQLDLVLLDVMMPEMDGYEVCQALRAAPATRNLPVIFLTAKSEVDDVVRGFEIGGSDYVTKPFRPAELLARVRTQLLLRAQQREIEVKNTEMKEMLQMVCHDVANHFSIISMTLDLAQMRATPGLEGWLPRLLPAVRNGVGLTNLIRDMRMSEDKGITLQPVGLKSALDEALVLLDQRVRDKNLVVDLDVADVTVVGERSALINSVFGNVLSNAIKFSEAGSRIELRTSVEGDSVVVAIRDHGIGMPESVRESLFDFSKSHSRRGTAGEKGTGFGMPLMRKFVLMFGGAVEVVSRDIETSPADHGTEFRIRLRWVAN
jgi:two-component system sensor histidine kinase/response regulator